MKNTNTNTGKKIVAFHIGRGGRFYNQGYVRFLGEKQIGDFTTDLFTKFENQEELFKKIKGRENLEDKYYECDENGDFTFFEKLGFDLGEKQYLTETGNCTGLTENQVTSGIGTIDIDGKYDTTYTTLLEDCDETELSLILDEMYYIDCDIVKYIREKINVGEED